MSNEKIQDIKDSMEKYISKLAEELQEGHTENFKEYLKVASKFHNYSFNNKILISLQKPEASRVAGYRQWQQLGRHVKKGEKSIKILAPVFGKRTGTNGEEEEYVKSFWAASVFDISQTEGEDIPDWYHNLGDDDSGLYNNLREVMESKGIVVTEENIRPGVLGASYGGRVKISPEQDQINKALTLIHEFAHELLHKGSENAEISRGVKECEAEATTYIVANYFGLESPFSKDYLLSWGNEVQKFNERLSRISKASGEIITLLSEKMERNIVSTETDQLKCAA